MPREAEECIDSLAMTVAGAHTRETRRFAQRELAEALGRMGVDDCITRHALVRRSPGGTRVRVRLRIAGDLQQDGQDPLEGRPLNRPPSCA
ncbi:MAG: hypothetical protein C4551_06520 [Bacillota bacterium]|jgi:hypothetical protein|nr:MAG: hypothetical protein C4551_06520 [Bacillota bacterium]